MSSIQIIMDRLTKLENDNTLLKSQLRELNKKSNIKPIDNTSLFSAIASRITKIENNTNELKKASHKDHDHKKIIDRIDLINKEIKLLNIPKADINPQLSEKDILKMICDKIPKQDKDKITVDTVKELLKKTITLDYVNKLYKAR